MSDATITCPSCGSDDVEFNAKRNMYICWACGQRFSLAPAAPATPGAPAQTARAKTPLNIFMSYGHTEEPIVRRIKERLEARGHTVWYDASEIKVGDEWRDKIAQGVASSNGVIACLSKHAFRDGGVCHDEVDIAIGVRGGNIKTILLDPEGEVRPPTAISHIQWLDMALWHEKLAAGPEVFDPWFERCMAELIRVVESDESLQFQGEITRISERLTVFADNSRRAYLLARPFQGRAWLAEQVAAWVESRDTPRVCLVTGDAGVGKSAFAAHLSHWGWKLYGRVAASFFCEAGRGIYNDPRIVIQTLAYLLACRIPQYRTLLAAALERRNDLGAMNADDLFALLIGDPLTHAIDGGHECMLIVVDGIDEAGDAETNPLAETLARYANRLPAWMKILVTSRRVSAATAPFGTGVEHIDLSSSSANNMGDVRDFLAARLEHTHGAEPGFEAAVDTLAKASGGIFLYASLMADAILKHNVTLADAAITCPQGLSEMFYQWFRWTFPDLREYRETFREALALIAAAPGGALPVTELPLIFGWDGNTQNDFLRRVEVFVRRIEDDRDGTSIAFAHAFIAEWLQSADAGAYQSLPDVARSLIMHRWLEIAEPSFCRALTEYETLHLLDLLEQTDKDAYAEFWKSRRRVNELSGKAGKICNSIRGAGRVSEAVSLAKGFMRHYTTHPEVFEVNRLAWVSNYATWSIELNRYSDAEQVYLDDLAYARHREKTHPEVNKSKDRTGYNNHRDAVAHVNNALERLADLYMSMGRTADAEKLLRERIDRLKLSEADPQSKSLAKTRADLQIKLARSLRDQGRFSDAEAQYAHAISSYSTLVKQETSASELSRLKKSLSKLQAELGEMLAAQGRTDSAQSLFDEAHEASAEVTSIEIMKGRDLLLRLKLKNDDCIAGSPFAAIREEMREFLVKEMWFHPSFIPKLGTDPAEIAAEMEKWAEKAAKASGAAISSYFNMASGACRWLAICLCNNGLLDEAEERFIEAIGLARRAYDNSCETSKGPLGSAAFLRWLFKDVDDYVLFLNIAGRLDDAIKAFDRYLPDLSPVDIAGDVPLTSNGFGERDYFSIEYARLLILKAGLLADAGKRDEAREAYRRAFEAEYAGETSNRRSDYQKATVQIRGLAETALKAKKADEADKLSQEALDIATYLDKRKPGAYLSLLANCLDTCGRTCNNLLKRFDKAVEHQSKALALYTELSKKEPEKYRPNVAALHVSIGIDFTNLGKAEDAARAFGAAADIYRELFEKEPTAYRTKLVDALSRQRIALAELGRIEEAQALFAEEANIAADLDESKATEINLSSRFFGNAGQIFVDMLLFENHRYDRIDFKKRDAAILELNKRLDDAAMEHMSDAEFEEYTRIAEGDFSAEDVAAFLARIGFDKVLPHILQKFATEWADKL